MRGFFRVRAVRVLKAGYLAQQRLDFRVAGRPVLAAQALDGVRLPRSEIDDSWRKPVRVQAEPHDVDRRFEQLRLDAHQERRQRRIGGDQSPMTIDHERRKRFVALQDDVERLRRQHRATGDTKIETLLGEIAGYDYAGLGADDQEPPHGPASDVAVPLKLRIDAGLLSFLSTTTIFGTAVEITLSELVLEAFYPADKETGDILRSLT